jgi:fibronectin-binding autotransporter adhesin
MKTTLHHFRTLATLCVALLMTHFASAQTLWIGTNGVSASTNWSDSANWSAGLPSGLAVVFTNSPTAAALGTVNNVVDSDTTVASLAYGNTNTSKSHNTLILPGVTLTSSGPVTAGTIGVNAGVNVNVTNTISGAGGSFVVNASSSAIAIGQGGSSTPSGTKATLDMSGLDNFTATCSKFQLGIENQSRQSGVLYLAKTNTITLTSGTGAGNGIYMSHNRGAIPSFASALYLGQTNAIFLNNVSAARARGIALIAFNPAFTNSSHTAVAYFRAQNPLGGPVGSWFIGDNSPGGGGIDSNNNDDSKATNDFSGGTVDAVVNSMILGRNLTTNTLATPGGTAKGVGVLTFDAGTISVSTLTVGSMGTAAANSGGGTNSAGIGIVNVNGGILNISGTAELAHVISGANPVGATNTAGTLNIRSGGQVTANTIISGGGGGKSTITLNGGTLILTNTIGTTAAGITTFAITNSTLTLAAFNTTTNAVTTNLLTSGANTINISALPPIVAYPAQYVLIKYSGSMTGPGFTLGTLPPPPSGPSFVGYISNNIANGSVDLVITGGAPPVHVLTWTGVNSGDWDYGTANWKTNAGPATTFTDLDFVTFDDTATGPTSVSLSTGLAPGGLTVNNTTKTYTFTGDHLSGNFNLNKQGSGTLIFDNVGGNDFAGNININAGTLQIGNAAGINGNLPPTIGVNNNSTLTFNQGVDLTVSNIISGSGTVAQNGTATLTLAGANTFAGTLTAVSGSIIRVANNSALGATNGTTIVSSGATLDLGGFGTANSLNLGMEPVTVSGTGAPGQSGAIVNTSSFAQQNALQNVTLAGDTTFSAATRWDIRAPVTSIPTAALSTTGHPYKLTKIGANAFSLVGVAVDPTLGDIEVQEGIFSVEGGTTGLGNSSSNLIVDAGATLQFFNLTNKLNKNIVLNGDSANNIVNNASGANTVVGPMTLNNGCIFNVGGTSLTLSNAITGTGSLTKNGTSTLIIAGNAAHSGGTTLNFTTLALNGTLAGTLTTQSGTTLTGTGTNTGLSDIGGSFNPGTVNGVGTYTAGTLTIQSSATVTFDLTSTNTTNGGSNDLVQVNGNLNASGNNLTINVLQGRLQPGVYRLFNYTGSLNPPIGAFASAGTASQSRYAMTVDTSTPHQVNLVVTGGPSDLKWNSTSSTTWDTAGQFNWFDTIGGTNTPFFATDTVTFDDSVSGVVTNVTLDAGAVFPTSVTNNSTVNNFVIGGSGNISGTANIVKLGTSTLTINATNNFTGTVTVAGGTLVTGSATALGTTNGPTIVTNAGTLDVFGQNLGLERLIIAGSGAGGAGAIVNSGVDQIHALRSVTLSGDTTFGGLHRWDIRAAATGTTNEVGTFLNTTNATQPYKLTKIGTNQVAFVSVAIDSTNLGDIDIQEGNLSFQLNTTSMGNPTNTLTVGPNALLDLYNDPFPFNKIIRLNGDGATIFNENAGNTIIGPVQLIGSNVFNIGGSIGLTLASNTVSGTGSLNKFLTATLSLNGTNTYTGNTVVNAGTLALNGSSAISNSPTITIAAGATMNVSGRTDALLTLVNGQTLYGNGTITGNLNASPGSTLSPGSGQDQMGVLSVSLGATLSGTTRMEINKGATNDQLRATSLLTYGGTLNVTNSNPTNAFGAGDSFQLFSAVNYAGGFTSIVPATPGTGLSWDTTLLTTSGTLKVVSSVVNPPHIGGVTVTGSTLVLSGTGGSPGGGFSVYSSTDVSLPLNSWTSAGTGVFDGSGNCSFSTSINPATPARFFILRVP